MASTLPIRAVRSATCSASHSLATPSPAANLFPRRVFSTTPAASNAAEETVEDDGKPLPRWSHTPSRAKAPFSLRMNSRRPHFHINSDPAVLDKFYVGMLGEGGDQLMSEEVKWLAVTHKSFDQGRRGFNDRLAFLGM